MNRLLVEIEKFKKWSELTFPCRIAGDIGGEWETGYNGWDAVYAAFEEALNRLRPEDFTAEDVYKRQSVNCPFKIFPRCPALFIQVSITASGVGCPYAIFSPDPRKLTPFCVKTVLNPLPSGLV